MMNRGTACMDPESFIRGDPALPSKPLVINSFHRGKCRITSRVSVYISRSEKGVLMSRQ